MRGRPKGSKNKPKYPVLDNVHVPCPTSPLEQHVGKLVKYYSEGYRVGHLTDLSKDGKIAKIRPIAAYRAEPHRQQSVDASTVTPVTVKAICMTKSSL